MELVSAVKEGATSSSVAALLVNTEQAEGVFVVDVEDTFPVPHLRVRRARSFQFSITPRLSKRH